MALLEACSVFFVFLGAAGWAGYIVIYGECRLIDLVARCSRAGQVFPPRLPRVTLLMNDTTLNPPSRVPIVLVY